MKKVLIPGLAVLMLGLAPGAFAGPAGINLGLGVSAQQVAWRDGHRDFDGRRDRDGRFDRDRRHDRDGRHHQHGRRDHRHGWHRDHRHWHGKQSRWHKHRNGRFYRGCH